MAVAAVRPATATPAASGVIATVAAATEQVVHMLRSVFVFDSIDVGRMDCASVWRQELI